MTAGCFNPEHPGWIGRWKRQF